MSQPAQPPSDESAGEHSPPPSTSLLYEELTTPDYADQAASTLSATPTKGGVIFSGSCPRCRHAMNFPHVSRVYRRLDLSASRLVPSSTRDPNVVPMLCTCAWTHAGRPAAVTEGCGAYWNIRIEEG